jgi:nitroreductase
MPQAVPTPIAPAAALERGAQLAVLAPSVHNTQPWILELHDDRLVIRADRSRQLAALDPTGRELVQSLGAALFNIRVGLAADGWDADVDRLPDPGDPDLLAVVRCRAAEPDAALARLAPVIPLRRTNRRAFGPGDMADDVLRSLTAEAAAEAALLVPVLRDGHRRLLARLTQQADRLQNAEPAYRAELLRWTTRRPVDGDGVPAAAVPRRDGSRHDDLAMRDFDTTGAGGLPAETGSGVEGTPLVLATRFDDPLAWLHCGEAMQRVLLGLTAMGWTARPFTQLIEVPLTRTQLRSALAWDAHPQLILRAGRADPTPATPRRRISEVVLHP